MSDSIAPAAGQTQVEASVYESVQGVLGSLSWCLHRHPNDEHSKGVLREQMAFLSVLPAAPPPAPEPVGERSEAVAWLIGGMFGDKDTAEVDRAKVDNLLNLWSGLGLILPTVTPLYAAPPAAPTPTEGALREALEACQWRGIPKRFQGVNLPACPVCGNDKGEGHTGSCIVGRALAATPAPGATDDLDLQGQKKGTRCPPDTHNLHCGYPDCINEDGNCRAHLPAPGGSE